MNKKMTWIGALVLAASLILTACGARTPAPAPTVSPSAAATEPAETPEATATAEPTEEPTEEPVSQPTDEPAGIVNLADEGRTLYAAQLDRYAAALSEQWPESRYFENGMSELAGYYYEGDARANAGVFFPDLDGDGSPEMVIGAISGAETDPVIFEIWTIADGSPTMIAQSHARDRYYIEYLPDDGAFLIAREGSSGAANSVWLYYSLQNGALALMQGVTYDAASGIPSWFLTYDEDNDTSNDTPSDETTAQSIVEDHRSRFAALAYTPYTELA